MKGFSANAKLAAVFVFTLILIFASWPSAFSLNNGNWYYVSFLQNPSENSSSCNFSQLFWVYNFIWTPFQAFGLSIQFFWLLLSVAIAAIGVFLQFKWVRLASGSENIAVAAAFLSFFIADFSVPASLAAPRHAAFFILMPLAYYLFFSMRKEPKNQSLLKGVLLAVVTAAIFFTNVLFALFFAFSIAAFYAATLVLEKNFGELKGAWPFALALLLSLPLILQQVRLLETTTPSFAYSGFEEWGSSAFGLWMVNPAKIFYSAGYGIFLLCLFAISAYAVFKAIAFLERGKAGGIGRDFAVFTAASAIAGTLVLFTPLGFLIAKIIQPGVFAEQFIKTIPFYLTFPLAAFFALKERRGIAKPAVLLLCAATLAYAAYFYAAGFAHPHMPTSEFVSGNTLAALSQTGGVILTDFYSGYLLSSEANAKILAVNPGYNVCLSRKQVEGMEISNGLFRGNMAPSEAARVLRESHVTLVFLNEKFWGLGLNSRTGGYYYPDSFAEAERTFDSYGLEKKSVEGGAVYGIPG